jgi:hypothetical protein
MKQAYITKRFNRSSVGVIETAESICSEYARRGLGLTLRQLYYQFVARGLIDNSQAEYKRIGSIVSDARLAGLIDWNHIEDRTRNLRGVSTWDSPNQILNAVASQYQTDRWADQPEYVEVWIEKDALVGVITNPCLRWHVPYFACRGYVSQSEVRSAGVRLAHRERYGHKHTTVIHLGDHDPSGIDMTRDLEDRLRLFGSSVDVRRIALNMDQVEEYTPPPNPAKLTDSRAQGYIDLYGRESWELDALDPTVIQELVEGEILARLDMPTWNRVTAEDLAVRETLKRLASNWDDVRDYVEESFE